VSRPWSRGLAEDIYALAGSLLYNSRGRHPHCFCLRSLGSAGWGTWSVFVLLVCVCQSWFWEKRSKGLFCFGGHYLGPFFGGSPLVPISYETLIPDSRAVTLPRCLSPHLLVSPYPI